MKDIVTKDALIKLADLAKVDLRPEEMDGLMPDMEKILEYFNEMSEVDTKGADSKSGVFLKYDNALREDNSKIDFIKETACEQFPDSYEGFLRIPEVFGDK
jgi:aspartyl-tRNA(Asn)/glutamyl-tRNA(Gln) amidotransferase subunit C